MKFKPKIVPIESIDSDSKLFVREMSWRERKQFEEKVGLGKPDVDQENIPNFAERLIMSSICDADGNLVFVGDDVESVMDLPSSTFWILFREAQKINSLSDLNVEEKVKN